MIGSRVYSARVPLLLAFVKHIVRRAQPRNESVFRCGDTTVMNDTFRKPPHLVTGYQFFKFPYHVISFLETYWSILTSHCLTSVRIWDPSLKVPYPVTNYIIYQNYSRPKTRTSSCHYQCKETKVRCVRRRERCVPTFLVKSRRYPPSLLPYSLHGFL